MVLDAEVRVSDGQHTILPDCDWLRWLRRVTGRVEFFLAQHRFTGNTILAWWVEKGRLFTEIECRPVHPQQSPSAWFENEKHAKDRLRPAHEQVKRAQQSIREARARRIAIHDERNAERQAAAQYARSQGMHEQSDRLALGLDPFAGTTEGGERLASLKAELTEKAKEKIIST